MISRLLIATAAQGSGFVSSAVLPTDWGISRYAGNPVIDVANNPSETHEQYVPAPIWITGGAIWVYVKGSFDSYVWKSIDGGLTFTLQNGGVAVIPRGAGGAWDHDAAIEPTAVCDMAGGTIRLWYKGADNLVSSPSSTEWDIGYATAPTSDPTNVTKDAGNPIYTAVAASTALTAALGTPTNIYDLEFSSVIKIGSTWHFYGYALAGFPNIAAAKYRIIHASGASATSIGSVSVVFSAPDTSTVFASPTVFRLPNGLYVMAYQHGSLTAPRALRLAYSTDGVTWTDVGSDFMAPIASSWEGDRVYAACVLKQSVDPFTDPLLDSLGRMLLYYSGQSDQGAPQPAGHHDNTGLAFLSPP